MGISYVKIDFEFQVFQEATIMIKYFNFLNNLYESIITIRTFVIFSLGLIVLGSAHACVHND